MSAFGHTVTKMVAGPRRYPVTTWVTMLTAVVGVAQLAGGGVVEALQRDRHLLVAGQWWRLVTPMFVQPSGVGQYAFNLIGSALVGIAIERQFTAVKWLIVYFGAGLAGNVVSYLWFPAQTGGGSSDGVAGLIGALVIAWWLTRSEPWWPAYLYGAFFAAYLTGLAAVGVLTSTVAGALTIAVVTTIRRHGSAARLRILVCVLIAGCAVLLTVLRDDHGIGLLVGILAGQLVRPTHDEATLRVGEQDNDAPNKLNLMRSRKYRVITRLERVNNRLTRTALRHGFGPPWYALLETTGRRSGLPRQTPVGVGMRRGDDIFWLIAAHGGQADYVRNIQVDPRVRVKWRGHWYTGTAAILDDDDTDARSRTLPVKWDAAFGRLIATTPMTIRIDLDVTS